jgi:hypothetical protein
MSSGNYLNCKGMLNRFLWDWIYLSGPVAGFQNPESQFFGNNEIRWGGKKYFIIFP